MTKHTHMSPDSRDLIKQLEQLQEKASKDALTGLLNRGAAEKYIRQKLDTLKADETCAMFIIDLDHFKQVNDTFGHQSGDEMLFQASRILSGLFRANDIVGRLGGDEFIIFLTGRISEKSVRAKGYAICQQLQLTAGEENTILVTASVGICLSKGIERKFEDLYRLADRALYESKREGRQRFHIMKDSLEGLWEAEMMHVSAVPVKLNQILASIDSGVALFETIAPYKLIYANSCFRHLVDIGEDLTDGDRLVNMIMPEDRSTFRELLHYRKKGSSSIKTVRLKDVNGRTVWCRTHITVVDYEEGNTAFMVSATDVSELKEKERRLAHANQRLQTAFEQTGQGIWEVDLSNAQFSIYEDSSGEVSERKMYRFPEGLIGCGWVHQDSVSMFRNFAQELFTGSPKGYGNFVVRYPDNDSFHWAAMSYTMIFDDDCQPVRAVGIIETLNNDISELDLRSRKSVPEALVPYLILQFRASLTDDQIRDVWSEGKHMNGSEEWNTYTHVLQNAEARLFSSDDLPEFHRIFCQEHLLKAFEEGERWFSHEYRRIDENGLIHWVAFTVILSHEPTTGEILLFGFLNHVEQRRQWENTFCTNIVRDPVTRLYTRMTAQEIGEGLIAQMVHEAEIHPDEPDRKKCAAVMIQIRGLGRFQPDEVEQNRFYITTALHAALGAHHISGQYSKDKVLTFFPDARSEEKLRQKLERAFPYVRSILSDLMPTDQLWFTAGAVCASPAKTSYMALLKDADYLCKLWSDARSDRIVFPSQDDKSNWDEVEKAAQNDQILVDRENIARPLTEAEKDVALRCLSGMLLADTLADSVQAMLEPLARYYEADRAYVLSLSIHNNTVTMPCEWTAPGKQSIQATISGTMASRLPLLQRCNEELAPVCLSRRRMTPPIGEEWHFMIVPIMTDEPPTGFLCVENAKVHYNDDTLPVLLAPYILKEKLRYHGISPSSGRSSGDLHEELPNLRTYNDIIYSFTSDTYGSLGAVCLDIPELASINSTLGFEYGRRLLWFVSQTLAAIFGKTLLFRTWDTEFVALCPNATQQVFLSRCSRLRASIQGRYPGRTRIGHTWAEKLFSGKELVEEARSIMKCEHVSSEDIFHDDSGSRRTFQSIGEAIRGNCFTVYFQPKVNMVTGRLCGAEALARRIADDGTVIPPVRFIEKLEKQGGIRDLDFHILDQTLYQIEQWIKAGYEVPTISVNFSRVTLFDPTALASVLAIHSRYPLVPIEQFEIEITEGAGNISQATLRDTMERFREFGIRFEMDDFGSQYSNLSIFTNVRFDAVKLDRSLVNEIAYNSMNQMLVRDIASICNTEGMTCIAEGVETKEQIQALIQAGCIYAQGYYYDRPIPAAQFRDKYLRQGRTDDKKGESPDE